MGLYGDSLLSVAPSGIFDVSKVFSMLIVFSIYWFICTFSSGGEFEFPKGGKNITYVVIYI